MMAEEAWALGETKGPGGEPQICHLAAVCAREVSWGNDRQELCMCVCSATSVVSNSMTPCPAARQAPPSMGFSRQEYWSGLPCPPPGDLSDPGIEPASLSLLHWQVCFLPLAAPYFGRESILLSVFTHRPDKCYLIFLTFTMTCLNLCCERGLLD